MIKAGIQKYKYPLLASLILSAVLAFFSTNFLVPEPALRDPSEKYTSGNAENIKKNHPDVKFWLSADKDRYFIGDEIRITLHFKNNNPSNDLFIENRSYDRSGRFHENKYIVDGPDGGWRDPLERTDYFSMSGGLGGSEKLLDATREYSLNDYVRFDKPGTYYIYCSSSMISSNSARDSAYIGMTMTSSPIKIIISESRPLCSFRKT
jgi:hypothetical protein